MKRQNIITSVAILMLAMVVVTQSQCAQIFIKDLRGNTYIVDVEKTDSIGKIRDLINKQNPNLNNNFKLIISGPRLTPRAVEDSETVGQFNLSTNDELKLVHIQPKSK